MRVGILGGTFDPIHVAHLIVAEEARSRLTLDLVLFIPAGDPWMKRGSVVASSRQRLEMVRLAIKSNPHFRVSSMEIDRPGPSYAVDTLAALKAEMRDAELYFVLGRDSLRELHRWKEPARVLEMCTLVAVPRPGHAEPSADELKRVSPGAFQRIISLEIPLMDISGTELRQRVARGVSIKYLVPEAVECYIRENHLYQE